MKNFPSILPRWIPAFLMMVLIFMFSSRSSTQLPDFLDWDYVVKKTGHVIEYGLLALAFYFALRFEPKHRWTAWFFAIFHAAMDEFHQSFVPGRHPSLIDVLVFDNLGASSVLWVYSIFRRHHEKEIHQK